MALREISEQLLARIEKKHQTMYQNANPHLKVIASRGFSKELFRVYTIHEAEGLARIDVTARRRIARNKPDRIYAVYIENGTAHVKSKNLPYDQLTPWDYDFELGLADDVAIEFDGYWVRDESTGRFNLVADEYPLIFRLYNGIVTVQAWQETPVQLSSDVTRICVVKGWVPAYGDVTNDQGLILFYSKTDGKAYYRNYAIQADGNKAWEVERRIMAFEGFVTDVALFRTNDFRIGFIVQNDTGVIEYVVTKRNWSGMSVPLEKIKASGITFNYTIVDVTYEDMFEREVISADLSYKNTFLYIEPDNEIISAVNVGVNVNAVGEDLLPARGDGVRTTFQMYWEPVNGTETVYIDGVPQTAGTDYVRMGRDIVFSSPPALDSVLTTDYMWVNFGDQIKVTLKYGLTAFSMQGWTCTDSTGGVFQVGGMVATDTLKYWQNNTDYPPTEFLLSITDFNSSVGDLSIAYDSSFENLLGEIGQVVTSNMSATFTPINLQEPLVDPPMVTSIWNE